MINLFNYIDRRSPIHSLTGATKLVCLVLWMAAAMVTYDTRLLIILTALSFVLFKVSKINISDVAVVLLFTLLFLVLNNILIYVFSPQHGVEIYGTKHVLLGGDSPYALTAEQLFYHFNLILKYSATIPIVILFVSTTNPSEFAASLNRIGIPYSISYSVALALRYIPDIQKEYHEISQSQQARGIEMSKKVSLSKRLKASMAILVPLVLSSIDRIDTISNAMELRGFGKNKSRTWYMYSSFTKRDYFSIALCVLIMISAIVLNIINHGRFYNPFV